MKVGLRVMWTCAVVVPLVFAACAGLPAASSHEVVGLERSRVMLMRPSKVAAVDIARMFGQRGFALIEHASDDRGITLRFRGERGVVTARTYDAADALVSIAEAFDAYSRARSGRPYHHYHRGHLEDIAVGSVFYVRVEPRGETATSITAIGRPMKDGVEACTSDLDVPWPCQQIITGERLHPVFAGIAEAEVVESVFSELWLSGDVTSPDPAILKQRWIAGLFQQRCLERQRELRALANRVSDPRARAQILGAAPSCLADGERVGANPTR